MGCDVLVGTQDDAGVVSIHAPTWGATFDTPSDGLSFEVSIHAPTWGATLAVVFLICHESFQSTHPHGVRLTDVSLNRLVFLFQSTHPHGVRRLLSIRHLYDGRFNPRTHMGCDASSGIPRGRCWGFNPRTHMGCDSVKGMSRPTKVGFNPRTHMGCDTIDQGLYEFYRVSIHAPTWGATNQGH